MKSCCGKCKKYKINSKKIDIESIKLPKVVLAGNPNVGKSVVFNKLTGIYADVSNFPGTTVDIAKAIVNDTLILDSPGVYALDNQNDEETVAFEIIKHADVVLNVVSALSLDRDLFFTQQLIDLGFSIILVINQMDEAENRGINIDIKELENRLNLDIIPTAAIKNTGIKKIKDSIFNNKNIAIQKGTKTNLFTKLTENETDKSLKAKFKIDLKNKNNLITERQTTVNTLMKDIISYNKQKKSTYELINKLTLNPISGGLISLVVLYSLYLILGVLIAGNIVDYIQQHFFTAFYNPLLVNIVEKLNFNATINQYLIGEFGLLTMTIQVIFGLILPILIGFNVCMAILEDSGYLPRLAVLTDRLLNKIGLNGKAVIPLILGFGCTTMATVSTRILGSKKERLISNILLALAIPCAAQLGVITALIANIGGIKIWIIYFLLIFIILIASGSILNKTIKGGSSELIIDIPSLRIPTMQNVFKKVINKSWHFVSEATPIFAIGSIIITTLSITGGLTFIETLLNPLTVNLLNLPPEISTVIIMGILRKDFGAAGLAQMISSSTSSIILSPIQTFIILIVLTLFVPCVNATMAIYKEQGFKSATIIWLSTFIAAFLIGWLINITYNLFI